MKKGNYLINGTMDRVIMEVYGISDEQYYNYNRDLQEYLYNNFYDNLKKTEKDETSSKVKKLTIFKRK